jgi:hypothetical protein
LQVSAFLIGFDTVNGNYFNTKARKHFRAVLFIGACLASTLLVLSQDEKIGKKPPGDDVQMPGKPHTTASQEIAVLDKDEANKTRLKFESSSNFVPREKEWKWPDVLAPTVLEIWRSNYRGSFSSFDWQGNALVPAGEFNTIVVTRTVDAGYDSREDPLLLVGQSLLVPESERKGAGIPPEKELQGFIVVPIASDLSALGEPEGHFSESTDSGRQEISVWFKYKKPGVAKYLYYAPSKEKDFTMFMLKQKPIRFSLKSKK